MAAFHLIIYGRFWVITEVYYDAFEQAKLPLGMDESPNGFLCRQIGFAVVPLIFGNEEATVMIDELSSDWLECAVN